MANTDPEQPRGPHPEPAAVAKRVPVAIQRLMDEVRFEEAIPEAYDRAHNRHNRGPGSGYNRGHNRHNR
jgi:hypothetical protein